MLRGGDAISSDEHHPERGGPALLRTMGLAREGPMRFGLRQIAIAVLFAFVAGLIVASFAGFREFIPGMLKGAWVTVQITVAGSALAVVMALIAALARMYGPSPVRWVAIAYIETFRGTSALIQLFWLFYVLPHFGLDMRPITVAIVALGLNVGAYGAEVDRGAIQSVPKGQWEACTALNMSWWTKMHRVILPQAFVAAIPPWGNLFIELLKASALVSFIAITELTFFAKQMNQTTFRTVEIFTIALVMYFFISVVITFAMRALERRTARGLARGRAQ